MCRHAAEQMSEEVCEEMRKLNVWMKKTELLNECIDEWAKCEEWVNEWISLCRRSSVIDIILSNACARIGGKQWQTSTSHYECSLSHLQPWRTGFQIGLMTYFPTSLFYEEPANSKASRTTLQFQWASIAKVSASIGYRDLGHRKKWSATALLSVLPCLISETCSLSLVLFLLPDSPI